MTYHQEPSVQFAKPLQLLKMTLPFWGMMIAYIEYVSFPNVYPPTYTAKYWDSFIIACAVFYLVLFITSSFFVPLRKKMLRFSWLLFGFCLFFTVWDYCSLKAGLLRMPFLPSPDRIITGLVVSWQDILMQAGSSFMRLLYGLVIGFVLGIVSGIVCGGIELMDYWIAPFLKIIGPVPALAWMPVLANISGSAAFAAVAIIVIAVWFPLTLLLSSAIGQIDRALIEHATILGASKASIVWHIMIPACMPAIMDGLFMAFTAAFGALSAAEAAGASQGMTLLITLNSNIMDYGMVFAVVLVMIVIFSGMTAILFAVRNRVLRWQKGIVSW